MVRVRARRKEGDRGVGGGGVGGGGLREKGSGGGGGIEVAGGALAEGQGASAGGGRGGEGSIFRATVWDWVFDQVGVARYTVEVETLGEGGSTRRLYRRWDAAFCIYGGFPRVKVLWSAFSFCCWKSE